ncbi:DUF4192 family protein [Luteococcus sp. OSA5]|uniref:DUF4192 family protein n=1 Tax=Luteococcus sp. OSA5 TaxID=3401630 RepID=UPI003B42B42C
MDDQHSTITRLRLRECEDFLALVPYLLGYQPQEQLVFVVVDDARIGLTGAMPLNALEAPEPARESLVGAVDNFENPMVLLACWCDSAELAQTALGLAEVWLGPERVLDSVHVDAHHWHSRLGGGAGRHGSREELDHRAVVAQAVVAGLSHCPSREGAVAVAQGPEAEDVPRLERILLDAEDALGIIGWDEWQRRAGRLQVEMLGEADQDWSAEDCALLAVLSGDELTRDDLCLALGRRNAAKAEALWGRVVMGCPPHWATGPLLMLGFSAWLNGNGAVLVACIERAHALGDRSDLLACLDGINRQAVPPSAWEQVRGAEVFGVGAGMGGAA